LLFLREVRAELRKVAWPGASWVARVSALTLALLVLVIGLIFVFDLGAAAALDALFER
jgi:preprotein translocase SecE subunit